MPSRKRSKSDEGALPAVPAMTKRRFTILWYLVMVLRCEVRRLYGTSPQRRVADDETQRAKEFLREMKPTEAEVEFMRRASGRQQLHKVSEDD